MNSPYVFKRCCKCKKWYVANTINFYRSKNGKLRLSGSCKECSNKSSKEWRERNKKTSKSKIKNKPLTDKERRKLIRKILFKVTGLNYEKNEECRLIKKEDK